MKENEFIGKKVLVTGSSRGIGHEIGKLFVKNGASVIFTGKSKPENLKKLKNSFYFSCDLTKEKDIDDLFNYTKDVFDNELNILICNLGNGKVPVKSKYKKKEWEETFNLNFFSSVYTIQKFLDNFTKSKNRSITCISSICGNAAIGCPLPYSVAKSALNSYVKNLSKIIASQKIRINCVSPGNILFPGSTWDQKLKSNSSETNNYILSNVPLQKFGSIKNISELVLFLSSSSSSFTTGSNFVVDGGQIDV